MNQVTAAAALFGVAALVLGPLVAESGRQIGSHSQGVSEMMEDSRRRAGELLVQTWVYSANGTTTVYLSSIGERDVGVSAVTVNGTSAGYTLSDQAGAPASYIESGGLGTLAVNGTGAVRVISESGKLFEFG